MILGSVPSEDAYRTVIIHDPGLSSAPSTVSCRNGSDVGLSSPPVVSTCWPRGECQPAGAAGARRGSFLAWPPSDRRAAFSAPGSPISECGRAAVRS